MPAERLGGCEVRRRGALITAATNALKAERQKAEIADDFDPNDVTKPRFVLTEVIPQPDFDAQLKSYAKKGLVVAGAGATLAALTKYAYTDPETGQFDTGKATKALGKVVAVGGAEGIVGIAGITARHHRELTHQSLELSKFLQKMIDLEQRSLGVAEPYTWASVHRIHHEMEDTSLFPFYRIHHAMKEADRRGLAIPEKFGPHLDPFVQEFDRETVDKLGMTADQIMRQRLADERLGEHQYKEPSFDKVSDEEILQTLNPTEPQYTYPEYFRVLTPFLI